MPVDFQDLVYLQDLEDMKEYGKEISQDQKENIVNVMTNEFPAGVSKKLILNVFLLKKKALTINLQKLFWICCQMMNSIIFLLSLLNSV